MAPTGTQEVLILVHLVQEQSVNLHLGQRALRELKENSEEHRESDQRVYINHLENTQTAFKEQSELCPLSTIKECYHHQTIVVS